MTKLGHESSDMSEEDFLAAYSSQDYPKPSVTSDLIIFTIQDCVLRVLLIKRGGHPFKDMWAMPGGFLDVPSDSIRKLASTYGLDLRSGSTKDWPAEPRRLAWELEVRAGAKLLPGEPVVWDVDIMACAQRELAEETSLPEGSCYLEQLCTVGSVVRDPRTYIVTVAHYALVPSNLMYLVVARDDAKEAVWWPVDEALELPLAFDHLDILKTALARIRGKLDYFAVIAASLLPPTFTEAEFRGVYETIKGTEFNRGTFSRRFRRMIEDGHISQAPGKRPTAGRSAKVYSFSA